MAPLWRLPSWALFTVGVGWMALREIPTGWVWTPPDNSSILAAFTLATYGTSEMVATYAVLPWLAIKMLGWVFGRHLIRFAAGLSSISGKKVLLYPACRWYRTMKATHPRSFLKSL